MTTDDLLNRLTSMLADANREINLDAEHWEALGTGQDTEEAEESGRLAGYAEGIEAALNLALRL